MIFQVFQCDHVWLRDPLSGPDFPQTAMTVENGDGNRIEKENLLKDWQREKLIREKKQLPCKIAVTSSWYGANGGRRFVGTGVVERTRPSGFWVMVADQMVTGLTALLSACDFILFGDEKLRY